MAPNPHHEAVRAVIDGMRRGLLEGGFGWHATRVDSLDVRDFADPASPADRHRVVSCLGDAARLSEGTAQEHLVAAVAAMADTASWTQTASYLADPPSAGFLDRYAHATLAGQPDGACSGAAENGVSLGLLLLGPEVHYPPHRHPADEVYLPLTEARWVHEDGGGYRVVRPGTLVHHDPWQPHGMRTAGQPLVAIYLWTGDVTTPSEFC